MIDRAFVQTPILRSVIRLTFLGINLLALHLLLRGHQLPGGGFAGGVCGAIALILIFISEGIEQVYRLLRCDPARLAFAGLALSLATMMAPMIFGQNFARQYNVHLGGVPILGTLHIGTPLLFDIGVFFLVTGVAAKLIFVLSESVSGFPALLKEEQSAYSAADEEPLEIGVNNNP